MSFPSTGSRRKTSARSSGCGIGEGSSGRGQFVQPRGCLRCNVGYVQSEAAAARHRPLSRADRDSAARPTGYWFSIDTIRDKLGVPMSDLDVAVGWAVKHQLARVDACQIRTASARPMTALRSIQEWRELLGSGVHHCAVDSLHHPFGSPVACVGGSTIPHQLPRNWQRLLGHRAARP